jgi:S-adenosylmethionine synthetase
MRVLLCGASGLVGKTIYKLFKENNIDIIGTYNTKPTENLVHIDFLNIEDLENKILNLNPDICISCIAERENEKCEKYWDIIKKTNIDIAYNLSVICKKLNIFLIHLSTDYVYDGINPPFTPYSETNPLQNYGISKLIAEKRIISHFNDNTKYLILRIPVLYSDTQINLNESAVTIIAKKVMNKIEIFKEDDYSQRHPLFINDFALFLLKKCLTRNIYNIHCFYNPYDTYTKYQISELCSKILNKNNNNIIPIKQQPDNILRPRDTYLYDDQIELYIKHNQITLLENGLKLCLNKFIHPQINNHNNKDLFLLIDVDGTLVDSEIIQWKSYRDALIEYNIDYDFDTFTKICHNGDIKEYLFKNYNISTEQYNDIKYKKKEHMKKYKNELKLIDGCENFINNIIKNNINYCVVTNSSRDTVELYKNTIPELNLLQNWIYRENYINPKPSSECYELALKKYYLNEKYIIGFENSICGLKALQNITKIIYFVTYKDYLFYDDIKNEDIYLIKNFNDIL